MKIEISNGELIDKITILEIKKSRISDPEKLKNINNEYLLIRPMADDLLPLIGPLFRRLSEINRALWEIEDRIREFEKQRDFGDGFVDTARAVYRLNDERSEVKQEINRITGSRIIEEKSYNGG